jgi:hypothetical protein
MKLDDHYTPIELARIAVNHVRLRRPGVIADMAAGEGSLLLEAARRWPSARIIATDIDRATVSRLQSAGDERWRVGRCDFLATKSRAASDLLRDVRGHVALLLLNPPFSCRGGSYKLVDSSDDTIRASVAMAFLLVGLEYLSPSGQAVAILPAGSLHNKRDECAWRYIRTRFMVRELAHWDKTAFPNCAASSVLVKLTPHKPNSGAGVFRRRRSRKRHPKALASAVIVRGTCPIHEIPDGAQGPTLVHYTDLRNATVILNGHRGHGDHRCVAGPAVLLPRVGRVTPHKVALLTSPRRVMISDCVIGLKTESVGAARRVRKLLVDHFEVLARYYVGTGAPHITLDRLREALRRVGVDERQ